MDKRFLIAAFAVTTLTYGIFCQPAAKKTNNANQSATVKQKQSQASQNQEKEFTISTTSRLVLLDVSVKESS